MSDKELKTIEDKTKTEQQKVTDFIEEYKTLCEKHQFQLVVTPAFKARDDGTWSVVLQSSVGKLPKVV
jgi:hypothetical protein